MPEHKAIGGIMKSIVLLLMLLLVPVSFAKEQTIYRCKQANGAYVFQHTACADNQITGNSLEHRVWRDMRSKVIKGKTILSKLSADIPSIRACKSSMAEYRSELETLKNQMVRLSPEHRLLIKAYGYLNDCAVCRTSAVSACQLADGYLDKAMVKLTEH